MIAQPNRRPPRSPATVSELNATRHGDVEACLRPAVETAGRIIGGCDAVGVSVLEGDELATMAWTGELARRLDGAQCRGGEGPAWEALKQLQVFNVDLPADAASWPLFNRVAASAGVRSNLSVPLTLGGEVLGALSLYSRRPGAFTGREEAGLSLAARVALVLGPARRKHRSAGTTDSRTREAIVRLHPAGGPPSGMPSPTHGGRPQ